MRINGKKELRSHFKQIRLSMTPEQKQQLDKQITELFLNSEEYRSCETLLCFVSTDIEVSTRDILERAFSEKTVLCPRCEGSSADGIMFFYKVNSLDELTSGKMGILEPSPDSPKVTAFKNAMCVLPGLSFDKNGYRLGFGGGYYDRFLADFNGIKAGVCYESCVSDTLKHNSYDIKADMLFTDKTIYRFSE